jgi:hypothetical protein
VIVMILQKVAGEVSSKNPYFANNSDGLVGQPYDIRRGEPAGTALVA